MYISHGCSRAYFRMNETLEVEGKYMLEELAMSECSSRATLSPLPPVIPSKDIPGDGKITVAGGVSMTAVQAIFSMYSD
jgi:hypothetical protein